MKQCFILPWVLIGLFFWLQRFKLKYHPEESAKRRGEQKGMLMKRVEVFMDFLNKKKFDQVDLKYSHWLFVSKGLKCLA